MRQQYQVRTTIRRGARMFAAACAVALMAPLSAPSAQAAPHRRTGKPRPAPIIIRFDKHSAHAVDFMSRTSKDRSWDAKIATIGIDRAFTEWMQSAHPYVFAQSCIKQVGDLANDYRGSKQMSDFDTVLENRSDLHAEADKFGHDVAFAEWFRTERPDAYRQHFGLDSNNMPMRSDGKGGMKMREPKAN